MNLKTVSEIYDSELTMNDIKKVHQMDIVNDYLNIKYKNPKLKQKDVCKSLGFSPGVLNRTLKDLDSKPLHKPNSKPTGKRDLVYDPETGKTRDRNSKSYKKEMKMNKANKEFADSENTEKTISTENNSNGPEKPISKIPRKSKGWNTGGTTEDLNENTTILQPGFERTIDKSGKPIYKFDPEENTETIQNKTNRLINNVK